MNKRDEVKPLARGRRRRGATTVFVAIASIALVGVVAFAIDLSRLNLGVNELQSAADASALRGAKYIQTYADSNPDAVTQAFSSANFRALDNSAVSLSASDVEPGWWVDSTRTFTGGTTPPNAVRVNASKTGSLLFGRLIGNASQAQSRRAIAWVANITRTSCPAPWGFPLNAFNDAVFDQNDYVMRVTALDSLQDILRTTDGDLKVAMILRPSDAPVLAGTFPFEAIDDQDGGGTNMNDYADQIANASTCTANRSTAIDSTEFFPGKGTGAVPKKTVNGAFGGGPAGKLASLCEKPANNSRMVDCYPVGSNFTGPAGVTVIVSWVQPIGTTSGLVKAIGGFKVMCVYGNTKGSGSSTGGPPDKDKGKGGGGGPNETCAFYSRFLASSYDPPGLPNELGEGFIVGYPVPVSLGAGTGVGDAPSLAKRLILVR